MPSGQKNSRLCKLSRYLLLIAIALFSVTSVSADITDLVMERQYVGYGISAGYTGMSVTDLDGDTNMEALVSSGAPGTGVINNFYYVLHLNASGNYSMSYISPHYSENIVQLRSMDTDADGTAEIYVATADGVIHIIDGASYLETATITVENGIAAMELADIDGDGDVEIVTVSPLGMDIYNAVSLVSELSEPLFGGTGVALGNIDDDAALEAVVTGADCGKVIDGIIHDMEWSYPTGFGDFLELADIDGDGKEEIVTIYAASFITTYDGELKSPKWEIFEPDTTALTLADVTGDGIAEILTGEKDTGAVHCFDGADGTELWAFPGLVIDDTPGVTGLTVGDVDNDGQLELVIGTGTPGNDLSYVFVVDVATLILEWRNNLISVSLAPLDVDDIDDDGLLETVMVSNYGNALFDNGKIHHFDGTTQELELQAEIQHDDPAAGVLDVAVADVDGDGATEFVLSTSTIDGGLLEIYDGATGLLKFQTAEYPNKYFTAIEVGDVDLDGQMEIVAGQGGGSAPNETSNNVVVFSGVDGTEEWASFTVDLIESEIYDVEIANVDGDATPEILVTSPEGLFVFDGITHLNDGTLCGPNLQAVETVDYDADGQIEIALGTAAGELLFVDGATMEIEAVMLLSEIALSTAIWNPNSIEEEVILEDGAINAIQALDIDGDSTTELLIASSGLSGSALIVYDPIVQIAESRFTTVEPGLGAYNNMGIADLDADGDNDVMIGSAYSLFRLNAGLLQYISASPSTLVLDPTTIGATSAVETVTVTNYTLTAGLTVDIPDSLAFSQTNDCAAVAPSGGICTVSVTFTPDAVGDIETIMTVSSTSPYVDPIGVLLFGQGLSIPAATASSATAECADTLVGNTSPPVVLTITNESATTELFFFLDGRGSNSFTTTDTCDAVPTGSNCTVSIVFSPLFSGAHDATLYVASLDPNTHPITVAISGRAIAGQGTTTAPAGSSTSADGGGGGCFLQSLGLGD